MKTCDPTATQSQCYWYQTLCDSKFRKNYTLNICPRYSGVTSYVQDYIFGLDKERKRDLQNRICDFTPEAKNYFLWMLKWNGQVTNTALGNSTLYSESVTNLTLPIIFPVYIRNSFFTDFKLRLSQIDWKKDKLRPFITAFSCVRGSF